MKKNWWKFLAVLLLSYVLIATFTVPLVPGGLSISIDEIHRGKQTVEFVGYNTHFQDNASNLQCFVAIGEQYLGVEDLKITDNAHLQFSVEWPDTMPSSAIAFYVNDHVDGSVYVSSALSNKDIAIVSNSKLKTTIQPQVLTDDHQVHGFPFQPILFETIRNLMLHVPMWFTMFFLMGIAFVASIKSMRGNAASDLVAVASVKVGLLFCILGLITGSLWARFTWLTWWTKDPQLNGALVVFIVYVAYILLRNSIDDEIKRARISAVFNLFAFVLMIVLLMVMPRIADNSLHPGKSGNPAFSKYDLDSSLRAVFYPAVIGWILLGFWIYRLQLKFEKLNDQINRR
ncbi:MAG: hypothetical protein RL609_1554 [Bacteroidota bacterium]|jgi:heme exporter protein C